MAQAVLPLFALLLSAAILLAGNGLQGILLPVRGALEGFSTHTIGMIASAYSAGFVIGCITMPHVIKRVGHIRTFGVMAAVAACAVLMMALVVHPAAWIPMRALNGVCFAGLYMVIESWLNHQASNTNRGQVFSVYLLVNMVAITLGQMLLALGEPAGFTMFALSAMAITLALVPVGLTRAVAPAPPEQVQLRLKRLFELSPVGVLGCFFVGLTNGAFGGLGAVFATEIGLSVSAVALFMSAAYLGGALAQMPLGRLSDRIDRRRVIILGCLLAALTGSLLLALGQVRSGATWPPLGPWLASLSTPMVIGLVVIYGSCIYPLYGLCVAHANDYVPREEFVEASSGLLLTWAIGATIGPLAAALVEDLVGPGGLFGYSIVLQLGFILVVLHRMSQRTARPPSERPDFVQANPSRSSPASLSLDPRAPDDAGPARGPFDDGERDAAD